MIFHLVMLSQAESQDFTKFMSISRNQTIKIVVIASPKCSPPSYYSKASESQLQYLAWRLRISIFQCMEIGAQIFYKRRCAAPAP